MRWFPSSIKNSLLSLLSTRPPAPVPEMEDAIDIEDIRDAMLALLAGLRGQPVEVAARRIRFASDVQGLWFLRGDLMAALAPAHGETAARAAIETISELFEGSLPAGLRSRPSPLAHHDHHDHHDHPRRHGHHESHFGHHDFQ